LAVAQTVIGVGRGPRGLSVQVDQRRHCVPLEFLEERDLVQVLSLKEGGAKAPLARASWAAWSNGIGTEG